jgi:DNA topoisomerase-1
MTQASHDIPATPNSPGSGRLKTGRADSLQLRRRKAGKGFFYLDAAGERVKDVETLSRIAALAIPPAYQDVRISGDPRSHLQAVGRDEAGRVQYRYHPEWDKVRERRKARRLTRLISALPRIRAAVARDIERRELSKEKAIACAVTLIDQSHIRVGGEIYARSGSHGAATLLRNHIEIRRGEMCLHFKGKGGKDIDCTLVHPPLCRALKRLAKLPGTRAIQFEAENGIHTITSSDINAYLRRVADMTVSAKDFRSLAASSAAALILLAKEPATSPTAQKCQLSDVMRKVSTLLANTPAVVRKSYVHSKVVNGFLSGKLKRAYRMARGTRGRLRIEDAVANLVDGGAK